MEIAIFSGGLKIYVEIKCTQNIMYLHTLVNYLAQRCRKMF